MCIFTAAKVKEVIDGVLSFYKIYRNGKCQFDDFCKEVSKNSVEEKQLRIIFTYMNLLAERDPKLPPNKFNSIKDNNKVIGYEFKSNNLRVYVVKQEPNVFVILGGHKTSQKEDIKQFKKMKGLVDFDKLEL